MAAVLAREPESLEAWLVLTECRLAAGDAAGAEDRWRRAAALAPEDRSVLWTGTNCALIGGRPHEAAARARRLGELFPDDPGVARVVGVVAASQNRTDDALACLRRIQAQAPDGPDARLLRAELGLLGKRPRRELVADARRAVDEMLADDPNDARAHRLRIRLARRGSVARWSPSRAGVEELEALNDALHVGVPVHAEVREAALRALSAALVAPWVVAVLVGFYVVAITMWWVLAGLGAVGTWAVVFWFVARRRRDALEVVPLLGRERAATAASVGAMATGIACTVVGVAALFALFPFDAMAAKGLGLGESTRERTFFPTSTTPWPTVPTTVAPPGLPPGQVGSGPTLPGTSPSITVPITSPPTGFTVPLPPVTREVTTFDRSLGLAELRYLTIVAIATMLVGALIVLEAVDLRRRAVPDGAGMLLTSRRARPG